MSQMADTITQILMLHAGLTPTQIASDVRRVESSTWTSAAHVSVLVALEDEWALEFTGEEMAGVQSVSGLRDLVATKRGGKQASA